MNVSEHVAYQLRNATVKTWPFPHFFVEDVFPRHFYDDLLHTLPTLDDYSTKTTKFHGRQFADPTQNPLLTFMQSPEFMRHVASIFKPWLKTRYPNNDLDVFTDLRLVRDGQHYQIGPHTDARWKLVSLLFYLPEDYALESLGTSIYTPKDPTFRCPGGPHHKFELFDRIYTCPFTPNSCFGFWKTDNSFHGVEPITIPCTRNVLLYNVYDRNIYDKHHTT